MVTIEHDRHTLIASYGGIIELGVHDYSICGPLFGYCEGERLSSDGDVRVRADIQHVSHLTASR